MMTTWAEELCRPDIVHLVGAFVPSCPSLDVKSTTLVEALLSVNARQPCLRTGEERHQARLFAFLVKMVLIRWRNIAIYPERYARAMLQADFEQKRTLIRLKSSIKPYFLTRSFSDGSTTTGGTSQPGRSSDTAGCTTSSSRRTICHDQSDVGNDGDFELLDDRLPPAARIVDLNFLTDEPQTCRKEFGVALADNPTTTPQKRDPYLLRRPCKADQAELTSVTLPKRRKLADEDYVEASLAEFAGDEQNAPINKEPLAIEYMLGDKTATSVTAKDGGLKRVHTACDAQHHPEMRRTLTGTIDAARAALCGQPVRKTRKPKRPVKYDRSTTVQRASWRERYRALKDKCSPQKVAQRCADARQRAGLEWDEVQLFGYGFHVA